MSIYADYFIITGSTEGITVTSSSTSGSTSWRWTQVPAGYSISSNTVTQDVSPISVIQYNIASENSATVTLGPQKAAGAGPFLLSNTEGDCWYFWIQSAQSTITPMNRLVPYGNEVQFSSGAPSPIWSTQRIAGNGDANVTCTFSPPYASPTTVTVQATPHTPPHYPYAIITDGLSFSRIFFIPTGVQAGLPTNVLSYKSDGTLTFTYLARSPGEAPSYVSIPLGYTEPNSLPPELNNLVSSNLVIDYVQPPANILVAERITYQYLTCYLLNLAPLCSDSSS